MSLYSSMLPLPPTTMPGCHACDTVKLLPLLLLLMICGGPAHGLYISQFSVPTTALRGQDVTLRCLYELEEDALYSLTWWKDDRQFFVYIPGNIPEKKTFDVPGVRVDAQVTVANEIVLKQVDLHTSGSYKCELVADRPSYEKDNKINNLTVIDQPESAPVLTGIPESKDIGDLLTLNCSSPPSHPPTNITWTINGRQAMTETVITYPRQEDGQGRASSSSGLQMELMPRHFHKGFLRVRCHATIFDIYNLSASITIPNTNLFHSELRQGGHADHLSTNAILIFLSLLGLLGT